MKTSAIVRVLTATVLAVSVLAALLWCAPYAPAVKAAAPVSQGWISSGSGPGPDAPSVLVVHADASEIKLAVRLAGIAANPVKGGNGSYTRLEGEGLAHGTAYGQPDLPVVRKDVEIPFGANASLQVMHASYREVTLASLGLPALIYPLQPPSAKCGDAPLFTGPEAGIYDTDAFYPSVPALISGEYVLRGHRAMTVDFNAVAYNPVRGILRFYTDIEVSIHLTGADMILTQAQADRYASPAFENPLAQQLLNFNQGRPAHQFGPKPALGYLIITPDSYSSTLAPFVTLKQNQGFTVTVAGLLETGATKEQIKAYIQHAYDTWSLPPSYVLMVGDVNNGADSMPTYTGTSIGTATDLYFATVAGTDYVPDIYHGRFPARSTTQLGYMVSRSLAYANFNGAEPWVKKAALLATDDGSFWPLAEGTQNYVINTYTLPRGYTGNFPNNPQAGGDKLYAHTFNANTTNVTTSINNGRSMVIYTGHGSNDGWAGPSFSQTNVRGLNSNGIFPFVAGFACLTNEFSQTEVFGETWLVQPANKGALAYLGSSTLSYWDEDDIMERRMVDRLYADVPVQPSVADMTYAGQAAVQTDYPSSAQYYWETYNVLGDPSVQILLEPLLPDFTMTIDPQRVDICNAGQGSATVAIGSVNNFADPVDLTLSGEPAGISHTFTPPAVTPPNTSLLEISSNGTTLPGQYPLVVSAVSGALTHNLPFDLGVYAQAPSVFNLLLPADNASVQPLKPTFTWETADQAGAYDLQIATDELFSQIVLDIQNLVGTSFVPDNDLNSGTYYYWRVRAHNTCGVTDFTLPFRFSTQVMAGDCSLTATPTTLYSTDFEGDTTGWSHSGTGDTWSLVTNRFNSPTHAFHAADPVDVSDQRLVSPVVMLPGAEQGPLTLRFWNYQDIEASTSGCYDGGILEVSTNGGTTWNQVPANKMISDPYDGFIGNPISTGNPLNGKQAWCGNPHDWIKSVVDISAYAGQEVTFRWRLGSDSSVGKEGWFVDDVMVQSCVVVPNYNMELTPAQAALSSYPGEVVTYHLKLTNLGTMPDVYAIITEGNGWQVSVTPSGPIELAPGASINLSVTVSVPFDAVNHSQKLVTVTATSQQDPGGTPVSGSSTTTLTIRYYGYYLPAVARAE